MCAFFFFFFFSSRRRHTRSLRDWSSDVCSSDLIYRVDPRVGQVDVPLGVGAGGHEQILLLASGVRRRRRPDSPARWTVQQLTTKGEVVGGSTFVFKSAG